MEIKNNYPIILDTVGEYALERTLLQMSVYMNETGESKRN
jgi:hypothetical protein